MKLLFLGTGSAFTVGADNFQSNMLLISDLNTKLLIDCGSDIRFSLHEEGFSHRDITDIYISHLHSDHVGGLEYIGFSTRFDRQCQRPRIYLSKDLALEIWQKTLSGGMGSISGDLADLNTFFDVCSIARNGFFIWESIRFEIIRVFHVDNGYFLMPSYGLFFSIDKQKILITTDTQLQLNFLEKYYERADLIFQDCETSKYPTNIHAHYQELIKLPKKIKQKMWLYGYQPGALPDALQDGFLGFVKRGQIFDFNFVVPT
jgi:ribonuclease BN (tRNA processing enzyme)